MQNNPILPRTFNNSGRLSHWPWLCLLIGCSFLLSAKAAYGADEVTRSHRIDVAEEQRLVIKNSVGQLDVRRHDEPQIHVEVTIEAGRKGVFRRKADVSQADITIEQSDALIRLAFEEDNMSATWVVYLPGLTDLKLRNGVGQITTEWLSSALDVEVGVGDVRVYVDPDQLGNFSANVGVGNIQATGVDDYVASRQIVTESSSGKGRGDKDLNIEVGVGDIQVKVDNAQ